MNPNLTTFFNERKAMWLKAKLKGSLDADEEAAILQEAEDKFSLATWLPDAARRAPWLSIVSHPSKFSHPSAKTTAIIAQSQRSDDGYLRTGNVEYPLDVFGNAAAMDVYKFLCLTLDDGQTILQHLEQDTQTIKNVFTIPTAPYATLKVGLLSVMQSDGINKTDPLVKQVYFPVADDYHLLSILTPSGLLTQLKSRIDNMRFSETTKQAKEARKKNELHSTGYDDVLELTVTGYGGTQPQNVSVLNSQNAGRAYLLMSAPPTLQQRHTRLPSSNFFRSSLSRRQFQDSFQTLDRLIRSGVNNIYIREGIRNTLKYIIDQVIQRVFRIRALGVGWSNAEHYQALPLAQRIWLDDTHLLLRETEDEWLQEICRDFARWLLDTYEYLCKDTCIKLSDDELREIRIMIEQAVSSDQEFFK